MNKMNKMYRRRSAVADIEIAESDDGIQQVDVVQKDVVQERELDDLGEKAQQVRILISRIADLRHYNALNDIDFVIEAIGKRDYAGSPALDVLPSHDDIDRKRRERVKEYVHGLNCWIQEKDVEDAVADFKSDEKLLRALYTHLGEWDVEKKNLATALMESLAEKAASPEDAIADVSDEEFIEHVYNAILGRIPDADDLKLRLTQLKRGETRQELIKDILESRESGRRMLSMIAESISEFDKT